MPDTDHTTYEAIYDATMDTLIEARDRACTNAVNHLCESANIVSAFVTSARLQADAAYAADIAVARHRRNRALDTTDPTTAYDSAVDDATDRRDTAMKAIDAMADAMTRTFQQMYKNTVCSIESAYRQRRQIARAERNTAGQ